MGTKSKRQVSAGSDSCGSHCSAFLDGVLYAAQVIAMESREPGLAGDILRDSGYTQAQFLGAQRKNGYRSREMCRHIRAAFHSSNGQGEGPLEAKKKL